MIKSVVKFDYSRYSNGIAFTLTIDPNIVSTQEGIQILSSLIKTYFELGGMQIQFNVVNADILTKAQNNPSAYRNLLVRVAGYSAYFVDLTEDVQNEIINRFQRTF